MTTRFSEENQQLNLSETLVNLSTYRSTAALIVHAAYTRDDLVYKNGKIQAVTPEIYRQTQQSQPNELVNKFGAVYAANAPLLLHKKLADVLIDCAVDLHQRYGWFTLVMDGLRTYDSGVKMQENRPDLVALGMLAKAGTSAHNRALAVDSKLCKSTSSAPHPDLFDLEEIDEHGHFDDMDMVASNRFYTGPMSEMAKQNRLIRLQAWQRASVKNKLPIACLFSEFWDDRVTGSPADLWRILSCRLMCIGLEGNPKSNPAIQQLKEQLENITPSLTLPREAGEGMCCSLYPKGGGLGRGNAYSEREKYAEKAYELFTDAWNQLLSDTHKQTLEETLCSGAATPPALADFIFHEWLENIHDTDLVKAGFEKQCIKE